MIIGIISHAIGILLRKSLSLEGVSSRNFRVSSLIVSYLEITFVHGLRLGSGFIFSFLSVDIQFSILLKRQSFLMFIFDTLVRN